MTALPVEDDSVILSHEAWEEYRTLYRSDPWEFALDICGFDRLVERFHKPVLYLLTHQTRLLIEVLKGPLRSAVISKIKAALKRKNLDFNKEAHFTRIDEFCLKLNLRLARRLGKTSCGEGAICWDITVEPNHAWAIVSRDDDSAEEMCSMIVKIIQGAAYRFFFPERIPGDERKNLTNSSITVNGRTRSIPQPCVTAAGVDSGWVSKHFDRIYGDDLVGRENKTPSKLKVVHDFQANKSGLKMPEWDEPFYDFTVGTRWAKKDDSAVLDADPECLTIYVMIEERTGPVTFANMMQAGTPTLPEWFDEKTIAKEKAEYIKNATGDLGPVALLANLFLTIAGDAAKVFNDAIVDARKFEWWENKENGTRMVSRLADARNPKSKILHFAPRKLEKMAGADPSASLTGDAWAVSALGRDPGGVHYQLKTVMGRGTEGFLDALLYINEKFDPEKIGIESAAMQAWVLVAISKDYRFANILHKFVPVPTRQQSKRGRAENLVAAPLEMGELYLSPDADNPAPQEMKDWDPDQKNASDACIDSIGVCMTLFTTPASGMTDAEIQAMAKADNERYAKSVDKDFGIPLEHVMEEDEFGTFDVEDYDDFDEEVA